MSNEVEKLKKDLNEQRKEFENDPRIPEEEKVVLRNFTNQVEDALLPLAELSEELESGKAKEELPWWKRTQAYRTYQILRGGRS